MKIKKQEVTLVSALSGDWVGLYVDGELRAQNHSLRARDVLRALGIEFQDFIAEERWMDREGSLPTNISDVVIDHSLGDSEDE